MTTSHAIDDSSTTTHRLDDSSITSTSGREHRAASFMDFLDQPAAVAIDQHVAALRVPSRLQAGPEDIRFTRWHGTIVRRLF